MKPVAFICALLATSLAAAAGHYQEMSVQDFVIDGPQLAKHHSKVEISGFYARTDYIDAMYSSQTDAMMMVYSHQQSVSFIPLDIGNASHDARAEIIGCRGVGQMCQVTLRGLAGMCSLTHGDVPSPPQPCLEVLDGGEYVPSAAEIAQQRQAALETDAREQADRIAKAAAASAEKDAREQVYKDAYRAAMDGPALQACIQSPEMAGVGDSYHKCLAKLGTPAN